MDELTLQRSLRERPPADPHYRPRLSAEPGVVAAVATTRTPTTARTRPMFTAIRFVAAATIVALFGGFLLSGVLTQPSDEQLPAVGASPSADATPLPAPALDALDLEWAPLELDPATFVPDARLVDIAANDSMLVIGGSVAGNAAIWTSPDGRDWERVAHDEAVFGGSADREIKAVAPWRNGFVAAGEVRGVTSVDEDGQTDGIDDFDPRRVALVWVSEDGTNWTRVPHDEAVFGGEGRQEVFDIAATDERVVIVGFDEEGGATNEDIAVWTSIDGLTWEHDMFGGGTMWAVAAASDGFLGVGSAVWDSADGLAWDRIATPDLGDRGRMDAIVWTPDGSVMSGAQAGENQAWTSDDGSTWAPAAFDAELPLSGREGFSQPSDLAAAASGLAMTVGGGWYGGDSAVLVSTDGQRWVASDAPDAIAQADLGAITGFGSHFVAIGGMAGNPAGGRPEIWTTLPPDQRARSDSDAVLDSTTAGPLPGVDLATVEVEPGVFRVDSDGIRSLSRPMGTSRPAYDIHRGMEGNIVAGLDGSVWWFGQDGFFRLGGSEVNAWPTDREDTFFFQQGIRSDSLTIDLEVGPDGTVWLARASWARVRGDDDTSVFESEISSFDGESWSVHQEWSGSDEQRVLGVEVLPDGAVWAAWVIETGTYPYGTITVARLGDEGWEPLPGVAGDNYGDLSAAGSGGGELWLMPGVAQLLQRYDGNDWEVVTTPDAGYEMRADAASDGTLWVRLDTACSAGPPGSGGCTGSRSDILARFDGSDWEVFDAGDGIPLMGDHSMRYRGVFEAVPDGSIWFNPTVREEDFVDTDCDGVANFDGESLRHYLRGMCIYAMDAAPDGAVWVQAGHPADQEPLPIHTYVITPEVAPAEASVEPVA